MMADETRKDWEVVQEDTDEFASKTERLKVPGGWLYRTVMNPEKTVALVFVPGH
jgi:hypothetical protein